MEISVIMNEDAKLTKKAHKRAWLAVMVSLLACSLMFVVQFVFAIFYPDIESEVANAIFEMIMYISSIAIPFGTAVLIFKTAFKDNDGYKPRHVVPKKPVFFIIGAVGVGYLVNIIINTLFSDFVQYFDTPAGELPVTLAGKILMYVSTAVLPAILEEWAFRGVILKHLLPYGKNGAILISSLLFGIMHVDPPRIIFASIFGFVLAVCYEYTRSIMIPMIIHFINNSIAVTASLLPEESILTTILGLLIMGFMGTAIGALVYYLKTGIAHKRISLNKPLHIGYKLSTGKYMLKSLLNPGLIPFVLLYSFFFYLYFIAIP